MYLGGKFDILTQRLIEILANIPFLFVVMIINNRLEPEQRTIAVIVGIMCIFSWIGMTYYMRTATYREKSEALKAKIKKAIAPIIVAASVGSAFIALSPQDVNRATRPGIRSSNILGKANVVAWNEMDETAVVTNTMAETRISKDLWVEEIAVF